MTKYERGGIEIRSTFALTVGEVERIGMDAQSLGADYATVERAGDAPGVRYFKKSAGEFERIRRITGYLVGDMSRWNSAKRAEEHDRVKHGVETKDNGQ